MKHVDLIIRERPLIIGRPALVFRDIRTGRVTRIPTINTVVNGGLNKIRDHLHGDAGVTYPTHCAVSDDGTAVTASSTGIGTEVARNAITERIKAAQELQINTFFPASDSPNAEVQKAGLVDDPAAGTFFAIALFNRRVWDANETLTVEWVWTFSG